jgi:hypothetical protein
MWIKWKRANLTGGVNSMKRSEKGSKNRRLPLGVLIPVFLLAVATAHAQQTTGVPCSPSATTTIDGKYLPSPSAPFGGEINLSAEQSKPCWPPTVVAPKGAPNILLIMTDDQGYGVSSTFGGVIPTPALDRVAKAGTNFTIVIRNFRDLCGRKARIPVRLSIDYRVQALRHHHVPVSGNSA